MDCLYINLSTQTERRAFLEKNFADNKLPGWRLSRLEAVDGSVVARESIDGSLSDNAKACFLSHRKAITESLNSPGHVLILEDDALFGKESCKRIQNAIASIPDGKWDLIYTDICFASVYLMIELFVARRKLDANQQSVFLELRKSPFAGSTAYVVNRNSKAKVLDIVNSAGTLDVPYDLYLEQRIHKSEFEARVIFPFPTSLSEFADRSAIQSEDKAAADDVIWNAFRRLVWAERDIDQVAQALERIEVSRLDAETIAFSKILTGQLAKRE